MLTGDHDTYIAIGVAKLYFRSLNILLFRARKRSDASRSSYQDPGSERGKMNKQSGDEGAQALLRAVESSDGLRKRGR